MNTCTNKKNISSNVRISMVAVLLVSLSCSFSVAEPSAQIQVPANKPAETRFLQTIKVRWQSLITRGKNGVKTRFEHIRKSGEAQAVAGVFVLLVIGLIYQARRIKDAEKNKPLWDAIKASDIEQAQNLEDTANNLRKSYVDDLRKKEADFTSQIQGAQAQNQKLTQDVTYLKSVLVAVKEQLQSVPAASSSSAAPAVPPRRKGLAGLFSGAKAAPQPQPQQAPAPSQTNEAVSKIDEALTAVEPKPEQPQESWRDQLGRTMSFYSIRRKPTHQ